MAEFLSRIFSFHGGVHFPTCKEQSTHYASRAVPLPERLYISLLQRDTQLQIPLVKAGERVSKGQIISRPSNPNSVPRHAPTSGKILAIQEHPDLHPSNLHVPSIVIEPDGNDRWSEHLPAPWLDYASRSREELLERIQQSGIAGMGGAGFPTARKLDVKQAVPTLIINGAECEPYITCDDLLMRECSAEIIQGARIMAQIIGAEQIIIGMEDDTPEALAAMTSAIDALGDERFKIGVVPVRYPSGNSDQLIELLLGFRIPSHLHATDCGVLCHNVGTAKAVYDAVTRGWPLIERYVTVTGSAVLEPGVYRARIGTPIIHLVEMAGTGERDSCWIIGGPLMGYEILDPTAGLKKTSNCILLLPRSEAAPQAPMPCIRCARCASVCPLELLPQQLYWYSREINAKRLQEHRLFDCVECGMCSAVCPSHIPLVQYFRYAKGTLRREQRESRAAERAKMRHDARVQRLQRELEEREQRLAARRAAQKAVAKAAESSPESSASVSTEDAEQAAKRAKIAAALAKAKARKAAQNTECEAREETAEAAAASEPVASAAQNPPPKES